MKPEPDKLLSVETQVERQLIGRVMAGYKGVHPRPPALPPSRFGSPRHRVIWAAVLDLHRTNVIPDMVAVAALLKDRSQLNDAGGYPYVAGLVADPGTADSLEYYATLIRQAAAKRAFSKLGKGISELALWSPDRPEASVSARYHTLVRRADSVCDMASRNGHQASLVTKNVHQILTEPAPPLDWVYEPWLGAGDICVLAGEPGLGKSWLALSLMFSLALSLPFAGVEATSPRKMRVLYLDEENNQRLVRYRVGKLFSGMGLTMWNVDPAVMLADYALEQGINFDDEASLGLLKRKVEELRPDWVIIDSLVRVHRRDENSNADMSALIGGTIKPLVRSVGAGAVIIHHLAKPSKERPAGAIGHRIRGASDIMGVADQVWGLEKIEDALQLTHIKCRMGPESGPLMVEIEDVNTGDGVRIVGASFERDAASIVMELFEHATEIPRPAIIKALEGEGFRAASRTASNILRKLIGESKLSKTETRPVKYSRLVGH